MVSFTAIYKKLLKMSESDFGNKALRNSIPAEFDLYTK